MMRSVLVLAVLLAGCEAQTGDPLKPPADAQPARIEAAPKTPEDEAFRRAMLAPHIYMSLQPDPTGVTSIVFAIDADKNDSPQNDPAMRITPENGSCNPQELRRYNFPDDVRRPIFGPDEAFRGVTAQDLPNFMAMAVTSEMIRRGLVNEVEESHAQNVCTRKLWERMILNEVVRQG